MSGDQGSAIQDVVRAAKDLWQAFAVPGAAAAWVVYRACREWRSADRKDRVKEQSDREVRDAAREQARLDGISAQERDARALLEAAFQRQRQELIDKDADYERLQAQHAAVCRDRDRGWHLARHWHRRAHDMRHDAAGLWMFAEVAGAKAGLALPARPNLALPDHLEDPP